MKRIAFSHLLMGILFFNIVLTGCKKANVVKPVALENTTKPVALENTTWRLTKISWFFANGNVQTFVEQNDQEATTWFFLNNKEITIENGTRWMEQNARWTRVNDKITITISYDGTNYIRNYNILELTDTFMKVDFEEQTGASRENGKVTQMIFEFKKQ